MPIAVVGHHQKVDHAGRQLADLLARGVGQLAEFLLIGAHCLLAQPDVLHLDVERRVRLVSDAEIRPARLAHATLLVLQGEAPLAQQQKCHL